MSTLNLDSSSSTQTVDPWDTVILDQDLKIQWLVLERQTGCTEATARHLLPEQSMTVGRTSRSDMIVPRDKRMSRAHFAVECHEDGARIRDLDSMNGLFLNGRRISESSVYDGDQIAAGSSLFTVRLLTE